MTIVDRHTTGLQRKRRTPQPVRAVWVRGTLGWAAGRLNSGFSWHVLDLRSYDRDDGPQQGEGGDERALRSLVQGRRAGAARGQGAAVDGPCGGGVSAGRGIARK